MSLFKLIQVAIVFFVGAVFMAQINFSTGFMETVADAPPLLRGVDILGHVVLGSIIYKLVFSRKPQ